MAQANSETVKQPSARSTRRRGDTYRCSRCKEFKPAPEFPRATNKPYGLYPYCWPCRRNYDNSRYRGAQIRSWRTRYNLSAEEYDRLCAAQQGRCAICRRPETKLFRGKVLNLSVDDDHKTGRVRGLLCYACNAGIGLLREDEGIFRAALAYLRAGAGKVA